MTMPALSDSKRIRINARMCPLPTETILAINDFLKRHEKFKGCYFWASPSSASERRSMEKKNRMVLDFEHCGRVFHAEQSVNCSCKNVYYSAHITVDGVKKTITALKNLI